MSRTDVVLPCGCRPGYSVCPEAERLWRLHMTVPNGHGHLDELRSTHTDYLRHVYPGDTEEDCRTLSRELVGGRNA